MIRVPLRQSRFVRGASLLDELTAVVVLSAGLLSLAGLQGRMQNVAVNGETQSVALTLAQSRLERLRGIAGAPDGGEGYTHVGDTSETVVEIAGKRLAAPVTLQVEVLRFQLQDDAGHPRYHAVKTPLAVPSDVPEFKRVTITASWADRYGAISSVVLPGILSRGAF